LTTRANLASVLGELGDYDTAVTLLRSSLAASESRLGADHPTTETIRDNLRTVKALIRRGDHDD
jgi:tetratricopeptide repeat protein